MVQNHLIETISASIFAIAVVHTFATKYFERLAHLNPRHAGLWHLLGEVEIVFGFWALVLMLALAAFGDSGDTIRYLERQNFTEPLFVFVILVVAGTRPVLYIARFLVNQAVRFVPLPEQMAFYLLVLTVVPLLGSLITEPAAMTLAALMLRDRYFIQGVSKHLKYATLAVLLVNVSIGGTLTAYAAPPVLMVAATWQWDTSFMLAMFGWKSALAVFINAGAATLLFHRALRALPAQSVMPSEQASPMVVVLVHLLFLFAVVFFSHHPVVFMGIFLFFLGYTEAYPRHQDPLMLREGLLVAFFLAGLVVLGGLQKWWLQPLLAGMSADTLYFGATALTAITDNAALTYLGSLIEGLSETAKFALVAGAVTGGGLTVIANAPNPAAFAILGHGFEEQAISPIRLFVFAIPPTVVAIACLWIFF
ncbi:MAG: hypothetical protein C4516_02105 [Oxalobacter sp.]|nr:MAG: hypothetical protein C4516_02105 [Oxalobacter sp.]